jgi:hypothetical protein
MTHGTCPSCGEVKSLRAYRKVGICQRCVKWFKREKLRDGDLAPHLANGPRWPKKAPKKPAPEAPKAPEVVAGRFTVGPGASIAARGARHGRVAMER